MNKETTTVRETVTSQPTQGVTQVVTQKSFLGDFFISKTNQIIFGIIAIIDLLLVLRIFFLVAGANQVGIVSNILNFTNLFVAPFQGIFPSPVSGNSYLDVAAIMAIIIWALAGFVIGLVLDWFSTSTN